MIAEIITAAYDIDGKETFFPGRKKGRDTWRRYPIGRFATCPLSRECSSVEEVIGFLETCRYVSDEKQFGEQDHWMSPDEFEVSRMGDCDDFAVWTWRQMMALGYSPRFVWGRAGRYGAGHAWVTIARDGKHFLVEALASWVGERLPRLSALRYEPMASVEWLGGKAHYFTHEKRFYRPSLSEIGTLVLEWVAFWPRFWPRYVWRFLSVLTK
jgi:hypothetical protein